MPLDDISHFTSGFILTNDQITQLAKHLGYESTFSQKEIRESHHGLFINQHMENKNPLLKPFNLIQSFDLVKVPPWEEGKRSSAETCWIIPTKTDQSEYEIDPESDEETQRVKAAVVATGIPEEYLGRFETFPNREYPWTVVEFAHLSRTKSKKGGIERL